MKRFLLSSALVLGLAPGLLAAVDDTPQTVTGTVLSTGNISLAVRTDEGAAESFVVVDSTRLPAALEAGDNVWVTFRPLDDERAAAVSVVKVGDVTAEASASGAPLTSGAVSAPFEETDGRVTFVLGVVLALGVAFGLATLAAVLVLQHTGRHHTA
jgi:hypothetical protein